VPEVTAPFVPEPSEWAGRYKVGYTKFAALEDLERKNQVS
jgi:hypothetical protein